MIRFSLDNWKNEPELYPMVVNFAISPLIPFRPIFRDDFGANGPIEDGSVLLKRDDGRWFCVPEDVYRLIRGELNG